MKARASVVLRLWQLSALVVFISVDALRLCERLFRSGYFRVLSAIHRWALGLGVDSATLPKVGYGVGRWALGALDRYAQTGTRIALRCHERAWALEASARGVVF